MLLLQTVVFKNHSHTVPLRRGINTFPFSQTFLVMTGAGSTSNSAELRLERFYKNYEESAGLVRIVALRFRRSANSSHATGPLISQHDRSRGADSAVERSTRFMWRGNTVTVTALIFKLLAVTALPKEESPGFGPLNSRANAAH